MFHANGRDHPDIGRFIKFQEQLDPSRIVTFKVIPEV